MNGRKERGKRSFDRDVDLIEMKPMIAVLRPCVVTSINQVARRLASDQIFTANTDPDTGTMLRSRASQLVREAGRRSLPTGIAARHIASTSRLGYARPADDAVASTSNPTLSSLHTFTEEEDLLRETVRKFSHEVVLPKVREMDEAEKMDPDIIKQLFEQGVGLPFAIGEG